MKTFIQKYIEKRPQKQLLFCLFIARRLDVVLGLQAALLTPTRIQSGNAASHNAPDAVVCLLTNAHVIHVFCTPERANTSVLSIAIIVGIE